MPAEGLTKHFINQQRHFMESTRSGKTTPPSTMCFMCNQTGSPGGTQDPPCQVQLHKLMINTIMKWTGD